MELLFPGRCPQNNMKWVLNPLDEEVILTSLWTFSVWQNPCVQMENVAFNFPFFWAFPCCAITVGFSDWRSWMPYKQINSVPGVPRLFLCALSASGNNPQQRAEDHCHFSTHQHLLSEVATLLEKPSVESKEPPLPISTYVLSVVF